MTTRYAFLAALLVATPVLAQPRAPVAGQRPAAPQPGGESIVAVVNGDVITSADVANRGRLFAFSTGLPVTEDVLARLRPQVTKQLVDERLKLQEVQRRKIAVSDQEIAEAIKEIEQRNGMPPGAMAANLRGKGVAMRTLIDQVRVQIGWIRVLRQELGNKADITAADIADQERIFKQQVGKPEYRLGEIFIPIEDPSKAADQQRFADAVIAQLRSGAPFGVVAAQFSQSQTALQGGDLGWVSDATLSPEVAAVVTQMPVGAISNPVRVPGGISIVTLRAKRDIGRDRSTVVNLRQAFFPFVGALNPNAPTEQQKRAVEMAQAAARTVKSCADVEEANKRGGSSRSSDPGEVRLEGVASPPLRQLLSSMPLNQVSRPIVSGDGVAILMICSREEKVATAPSKDETSNRLLQERVELASRQLLRDLRRRAVLDERGAS
jgi:peptidyl-prolyl cis-trans isomerase SurA